MEHATTNPPYGYSPEIGIDPLPTFRSDAFADILDQITDEMMPRLSPSELRILLLIARETAGRWRPTATLSIADMCERTGMVRSSVWRGVSFLVWRGLLHYQREHTSDGGTAPNRYWLSIETEGGQ